MTTVVKGKGQRAKCVRVFHCETQNLSGGGENINKMPLKINYAVGLLKP